MTDLPVGALARAVRDVFAVQGVKLVSEQDGLDVSSDSLPAAILPALHADPEYRAWLLARARELFRKIPPCTGCDFDHGWDDHVLAILTEDTP